MRLSRNEIQKIIAHKDEQHPILSLYINLTQPDHVPTILNSLIRNTLKEFKESDLYRSGQVQGLERLCRDMAATVQAEMHKPKSGRMLAMFANTAGLWKVFHLPVALPSRMDVDIQPYTKPLSVMMDEFPAYCVLVSDSRKARIFLLSLGEVDQDRNLFIQDEVPDNVRAKASMTAGGGRVMGGLGDQRIQRHIQDHVHRHLKNVADQTLDLLKDPGFDRVLLGGTESHVLSKLRNHLHSYVQQRIAGEFTADPGDKVENIRTKALEAAQEWERDHESQVITKLMDTHNSGGLAVVGVEPVLEALSMGQVHTLLVAHDLSLEGYICPSDRTLSTYLQTCPLCGHSMHPTADLVEEMVQEAIFQNAEVNHIFLAHPEFSAYGIGAFLRFAV